VPSINRSLWLVDCSLPPVVKNAKCQLRRIRDVDKGRQVPSPADPLATAWSRTSYSPQIKHDDTDSKFIDIRTLTNRIGGIYVRPTALTCCWRNIYHRHANVTPDDVVLLRNIPLTFDRWQIKFDCRLSSFKTWHLVAVEWLSTYLLNYKASQPARPSSWYHVRT